MSEMTQPSDMASTLRPEHPLLLVGAGKMGGAMLAGWIAGGLNPSAIRVQDDTPSTETMSLCAEHTIPRGPLPKGVTPRVIIMAVKPQIMDQVFPNTRVPIRLRCRLQQAKPSRALRRICQLTLPLPAPCPTRQP
jgi:hypothetical protein